MVPLVDGFILILSWAFQSESDVDVYLRLFMFDNDVTPMLASTRALMDGFRKSSGYPKEKAVPRGFYLSTPFGRLLRDQKYVGCHVMVGKIGMRPISKK